MANTRPDIMRFFTWDHLPPKLQLVSKPFGELAEKVAEYPDGPEKSVALRKLLEAKDAAVRAVLLFVAVLLPALAFAGRALLLLALVLLPSVALAQDVAAPAPSLWQSLLAPFLTPTGIASLVGSIAAIVFGLVKLSAVRKKQIASAVYYGFHAVEDHSATTENTVDDKVAWALGAIDKYMLANGWRPLKPGETDLAKLGLTTLHGEQKAAEKVAIAAALAPVVAAAKAETSPPTP